MTQLVAYKKKIESRAAGIFKSLKITLVKCPQWVKWKGTRWICKDQFVEFLSEFWGN